MYTHVKLVESGSVARFGGSVIGPRRNYYMQVGRNFSPLSSSHIDYYYVFIRLEMMMRARTSCLGTWVLSLSSNGKCEVKISSFVGKLFQP